MYTADQIIEDFRSDVFDRPDVDDNGVARDMLWSDGDILRYLNSAAQRLASDTLALRKNYVVPFLAGQALTRFPFDQVIDILSVNFTIPGLGVRRHLRIFDIDAGIAADDYGIQIYNEIDTEAQGMPTHWTRDFEPNFLRVYKIPQAAGTLSVRAIILPNEIVAGMPLPFTARQDIDLLLAWMKKMAYAKQDADTLDLSRSEKFEKDYLRDMPNRKSEIDRMSRDNAIMSPNY